MKYHIYQLVTDNGDIFYIGRTNDPSRRLSEHQYNKATGTEDKYEFIRMWEQLGHTWSLEVINTYTDNDHNYEDYHIYTALVNGHCLTNMMKGSVFEEVDNALFEGGYLFDTAADFDKARQVQKQSIADNKKLKAKRMKREQPGKSVHMDDLSTERFESPYMKKRRLAK